MSFKVAIYCPHGARHQVFWGEAARQGFVRHGFDVKTVKSDEPVDCDLAVFWGHRRHKIIRAQQAAGRDYLVMERGYIGDRFVYTSMGFNGLNGRAEFYAENMPGDRWEKHFDGFLQSWQNKDTGYVLLIGQVGGDASLQGIDIRKWCQSAYDQIKSIDPDVRVRFRQHPIEEQRGVHWSIKNAEKSISSLADDLLGARCCITYNSNTGVDAILAGVPTIAVDSGSMVYNLAAHEVTLNPPKPDRTQWAYNMAYCQWTEEEIANGEAWEHLKQKYQ